MRGHSPDQITFLAALVGVCLFTAFWLPLVKAAESWGPWVQAPMAALPLLLLITVCVVCYRWFRD